MKYHVWVCLEAEYNDIEADSEEEAFQIASDAAMSGGSWDWTVKPIGEDDDNDGTSVYQRFDSVRLKDGDNNG